VRAGIVPVQKVLAFDSFTDNPPSSNQPQLPVKIEATGIFGNPFNAANPAQLILINDNDFGIAGDLTRFTLFNVAASVYQTISPAPAPAPVTATPTPTPTGTPTPTPTPVNCIQTFPAGGICDFASATPNQVILIPVNADRYTLTRSDARLSKKTSDSESTNVVFGNPTNIIECVFSPSLSRRSEPF
jgi:hypothetical protein